MSFKKAVGVARHGINVVGPISDSLRELVKSWTNIKSIGQAINVTTVGDKDTIDVRYYISSRPPKVSEFANSVRKH